jgi:hypothetical protein
VDKESSNIFTLKLYGVNLIYSKISVPVMSTKKKWTHLKKLGKKDIIDSFYDNLNVRKIKLAQNVDRIKKTKETRIGK